MNLKKFKLINFRKFKNNNNEISFVLAPNYGDKVNIAPVTTLIIGQNNGGKTTVIEALKRVINGIALKAEDFNFNYLSEYLKEYKENIDKKGINKKMNSPLIEFEFTIEISNDNNDLLTNIIPILTIGNLDDDELKILVKWEAKDEGLFFQKVNELFERNYDEEQLFLKFLEIINRKTEFKYSYYNSNGDELGNNVVKNLINIEAISANNVTSEDCLSKSFSKIVDYRYNNLTKEDKEMYNIDEKIEEINKALTKYLKDNYTESINESLKSMLSSKKCQVLLRVDMSFQNLIRDIVKYEYVEKDKFIPENQFGLGYTNLMMIVADIITYIDKYPSNKFNSQINLIAIEEPETYMHPQMQELFIRHINSMVSSLLSSGDKNVNSQIIITTHSAHILNSKIHEGDSFSNINYVTTENDNAKCIVFDDQKIKRYIDKNSFEFLKKHIKFGISEMFFSDAAIFVEGITEYVLLKNELMENNIFNKYYISIFLVNGAHAQVYDSLIRVLNIPTLIITDIDFKREKFEKNEKQKGKRRKYLQMKQKELGLRKSTNKCVNYYYKNKTAKDIINGEYYTKNNLMVVCQKNKINGYYATSFEEALILTNKDNDALKKIIKDVNKSLKEIVDGDMKKKSYELQMRLSSDKSKFANDILYEVIVNEEHGIEFPEYIKDGLEFIKEKLGDK